MHVYFIIDCNDKDCICCSIVDVDYDLSVYFTGRKFALVEGVNHDLVCAGSNYHVHFAWQVWHGQYSPGLKFNKLKSFSRVEIDRTHVDLKEGERVCTAKSQQA